jgi:hypothetical protein
LKIFKYRVIQFVVNEDTGNNDQYEKNAVKINASRVNIKNYVDALHQAVKDPDVEQY